METIFTAFKIAFGVVAGYFLAVILIPLTILALVFSGAYLYSFYTDWKFKRQQAKKRAEFMKTRENRITLTSND